MDAHESVVISRVLAEIKARRPELAENVTPRQANDWLVEKGLLYKDEATGAKLPTGTGLMAGIVTELRKNAQGEPYIATLYPEQVRGLVESLLEEKLTREISVVASNASAKIPLYLISRTCWKCDKVSLEIPTYINFEQVLEPVTYPWDKILLNKRKSSFEHDLHVFTNASIEFYPISVVGQNPYLDQLLVEQFPDLVGKAGMRVRETSRMKGYRYLAAHCPKCKVVQGWYPSVYEPVNRIIASGRELRIAGYLEVPSTTIGERAHAGNTIEKLWSFMPR